MVDTPQDDEPDRTDETSKLELPSLRLPRLGRRKKRATTPADPRAEITPAPPEQVAQPPSPPAPPREPAVPPAAAPQEEDEPTRPLPAVTPTATRSAPATAPSTSGQQSVDLMHTDPATHAPSEPEAETSSTRRPFKVPTLSGRVAAATTGLLVGAFGAMLTYVALRGCDAIRGTASCGGAGLLLLAVILVLMVLLGGVLLALWNVTDPRSTSFLAVGVLCVIVLLTLIEQLFSPWMFLVVPVLGVLAYLLSHWVTTTFIEPRPEKGPERDVR